MLCVAIIAQSSALVVLHRRGQWRMLNRLFLDSSELGESVTKLGSEDRRTKQVRDLIWRGRREKESLRIGVIDGGVAEAPAWLDADGGLVLETTAELLRVPAPRPSIDVVLALPPPLRLKRVLPVIASLGVDKLWLTGAERVDRAYFGSRLLRDLKTFTYAERDVAEASPAPPGPLRDLLVEGAEQSGFAAIPRVALVSSLPTALHAADNNVGDPNAVRCVAHPDRGVHFRVEDTRTGDFVALPEATGINGIWGRRKSATIASRAVLAVGPDRGWEEPNELAFFSRRGYDCLTLGPRTLRTDVALVALITLVHSAIDDADN